MLPLERGSRDVRARRRQAAPHVDITEERIADDTGDTSISAAYFRAKHMMILPCHVHFVL